MIKARKLQDQEKGDAKYGASIFADLTPEEFRRTHLSPVWDTSYNEFLKPAQIPTETPPDAFDWRDHNAVTPVKNQVSASPPDLCDLFQISIDHLF